MKNKNKATLEMSGTYKEQLKVMKKVFKGKSFRYGWYFKLCYPIILKWPIKIGKRWTIDMEL
jgi:hypothetical protein